MSAAAGGQARQVEERTNLLPWALLAGALVVVLVLIFWPRTRAGDDALAVASGPPITGTSTVGDAVDLSSMTPREAADRLFNRVMQHFSNGDSAEVRQFLPMALGAYELVDSLDNDGHYHLAVLHLVNDDPQAALLHAEIILASEPDHLFGLITGAQALSAQGEDERAHALYTRFLEVYEEQTARNLPEYREHERILPSMREEAREATG